MLRKQCRIWWPMHLSSQEPSSDLLLFGWCFHSSRSLDVVIAHATSAAEMISPALGQQRLELQEFLHSINLKMPIPLQEASSFCMLGQCTVRSRKGDVVTMQNHQGDLAWKGKQFHGSVENGVTRTISSEDGNENTFSAASCMENHKRRSCGCQILNPSVEPYREILGNWIQLLVSCQRISCKNSRWTPEFHHMHQSDLSWSNCDVHLIFYELPTYGRHHFSVRTWGYCKQAVMPSKTPNWFNELHKRSAAPNLEAVVWALNCASAAMVTLKGISTTTGPAINFDIISRLLSMLWYVLAVLVASMSMVMYVVLQLFHGFLKFGAHTFFSIIPQKNITDNLLCSGCVWLMGIPAGFKLNRELAELLGMVSLNAIQIFSTLWFFLGFFWWHFIKGLALSGIILGLTVPAALCIDMLKVATLHVQTLHWLMSLLYSQQIQALASLWRLFRGRKWNPLRQRLDSYDYTVEQHVVGALFFTPLLLLLPTTSVFYIFFTILNAIVCFTCIVIEISISILHATPYAELLLWVARKKRFSSGIWFEIMSGHHGLDKRQTSDTWNIRVPNTVISLLHANYATIGFYSSSASTEILIQNTAVQIVSPSYRNLFQRLKPLIGGPSVFGILSGQRIPASLQIDHRQALPWMQISCWEYWRVCHSAVLGRGSSY
ncbi:uncharacterized protein LOC109847759 isoform X4 [Asparagus officinalis]|uniref:uncharacterized protein LOC109847759 isoform X4 n=1 Tax=Asparagus officinalis TaxID=4686 RepID=UPI00098E71AD|nr:uncharacterized protein LOC109847759 isoform X4 [Asparagus officinalis]